MVTGSHRPRRASSVTTPCLRCGFPPRRRGRQAGILAVMRILFLGTGASGGTPGYGRSRRLESSLLVSDAIELLVDVTRHFAVQAERVGRIDAILLTHGHR